MYEKGLNVSQDMQKAKEWYEKAAYQGSDAARINLLFMRDKGLIN
jgi:TPR repeat protein